MNRVHKTKKQIGDGPLVSNQERRAAVVPRINRSSTARCVPRSVLNWISLVRAPKESSGTDVFGALRSKMNGFLLGASSRHRPNPLRLALPRPATPRPRRPLRRCAPPRSVPLVVYPGFGFDKIICLVQNPDIPQAGRVGAHGRVAGRGRAGLYANRTVRLGDNPFSYPPKHRRNVA